MTPTRNQQLWSAGLNPRMMGRCDQLAKLYRQMEQMELMPNTSAEEWTRLSGEFAALRANWHANKCAEKAQRR